MKQLFCLIALTLFLASSAVAEQSTAAGMFTLNYRAQNQWVHQDDIKALRGLIKAAKKQKTGHILIQLPENNRNLAIKRAEILRDVLLSHLKRDVVLEEIKGAAPTNSLRAALLKKS